MKSFNLERLINQTLSTTLSSQIFLPICLKLAKSSRNTFKIRKMGIQIGKELCI